MGQKRIHLPILLILVIFFFSARSYGQAEKEKHRPAGRTGGETINYCPLPVKVGGIIDHQLAWWYWLFDPAPSPDFLCQIAEPGRKWSEIQVPGEWVMQGFAVTPGQAALYFREFSLPAEWDHQQVYLRCEAIYLTPGFSSTTGRRT
jgi:hypothetical protein